MFSLAETSGEIRTDSDKSSKSFDPYLGQEESGHIYKQAVHVLVTLRRTRAALPQERVHYWLQQLLFAENSVSQLTNKGCRGCRDISETRQDHRQAFTCISPLQYHSSVPLSLKEEANKVLTYIHSRCYTHAKYSPCIQTETPLALSVYLLLPLSLRYFLCLFLLPSPFLKEIHSSQCLGRKAAVSALTGCLWLTVASYTLRQHPCRVPLKCARKSKFHFSLYLLRETKSVSSTREQLTVGAGS